MPSWSEARRRTSRFWRRSRAIHASREEPFNTGFIAEEFPGGYTPAAAPIEDPSLFIGVAAAVHWRYAERSAKIAGQVRGLERDVGDARVVHLRGEAYPVRVRSIPGGQEVFLAGNSVVVQSDWKLGEPLFTGTLRGKRVHVQLERAGIKYLLTHAGVAGRGAGPDRACREDAGADAEQAAARPRRSSSCRRCRGCRPSSRSHAGQEVKAGEKLAVIEAMKMENVLRAENDAVVAKLLAKAGDSLAVDQPILEFR